MTNKKSKVAEFFGTVGMGLAFVWMLPVLAVEGLQEHFEKKRKAKQPKPEPIQFVCSECGETFEADNVKKEMRNHTSSNGDYTYTNPQPCPKCGGKRTRPTESDKAFYQRLWDMEETATFISHLSINWGPNDSPVDEKRASRYESIWLLMELAEKERKEDKKEAIFEKFAANSW